MTDKKHGFEIEMMILPQINMTLSDFQDSHSDGQRKVNLDYLKPDPKNERVVKRLISYLKDEK